MAEHKGGSDLDIFEGLSKKAGARPSGLVPPMPPSSAAPPSMGGPLSGPAASRDFAKSTMLGMAPPAPPPLSAPPRSHGGAPPLSVPPRSNAGGSGPPGPPPTAGTVPKTTLLGVAPPPGGPHSGPPRSAPSRSAPPRNSLSTPPPLSRPPGGGPPPSVARPTLPGTGLLPPVTPPPTRPPSIATAASSSGKAVDMDWDDEEAKTSVYDRQGGDGELESSTGNLDALELLGTPMPAAGSPAQGIARLASTAPMPAIQPPPQRLSPPRAATPLPPLAPPVSQPPMSQPPMSQPPAPYVATSVSTSPVVHSSRTNDPTELVRSPAKSGKAPLVVVAVLGLVAAAGGLVYVLQPKTGTLLIAVKSGGRAVENAKVFIDDKPVCDAMPCKVQNVAKGTRSVVVKADGYSSNTELVAIHTGEETPVTISLEKATPASPAVVATGFRAKGPSYIHMFLDGKDDGALPVEIKDASSGQHALRFSAGDRYKTDERTVTIGDNEVKDLGAIALPVVRGKATLNLATPGAKVTLASGTDRKAVAQFPISIDIDTSKQWTIEAVKAGFEDYKQPISFDDGDAEKTFSIALTEKGKAPPAVAAAPRGESAAKVAASDHAGKSTDAGVGTLNINSIPPSNCILDGRPLGSTPKSGLSVSAGTHNVVFIHPDMGRKSASVTVGAGETKSAAVRFPLALRPLDAGGDAPPSRYQTPRECSVLR